ncbi:glycosyltransferase family 4 protein [Streptomyces sp. 142MFCol3.1]|uniref:glycosyltransferase family 4 protein n=1 Tax=Streptomyces sp. 142MFCol3.1 TaxID=1172179 RepID=UPI0003FAD428|nr:glycosyltransferase family 4 protein [Streptomyces sp. 142MFCol3.1]
MTSPRGRSRDGGEQEAITGARRLRIVVSAYACDPSRGTEPGMGWAWAEALARRGHTVELLTRPHGDNTRHIAARIEELGAVGRQITPHVVDTPRCPGWVRLVPGFLRAQVQEFVHYDGWQRRALAYARRNNLGRADLVHHVSYGSLVGGSALHRLGPPLVFGPVGGGQIAPRSHRRWLGPAYRQERTRELLWVNAMSLRPSCRATLRHAAAVLTTNRDTAQRARRLGRADPHLVLSDGVPDTLLKEPPHGEPEQDQRPPTVLWVGRLTAIKAPELALRAFALLLDEVPDARLVVLGDGPLRPGLEQLTARLGVTGSVRFGGRLPWKQTLAAYDRADVLLFTSLRDSFGVQNLEAWARGLPVVHLDHQGVGDFSAPGCAVPVALGDPADLPQRLARALGGVLTDEEARRRMAGAGLHWARQHTWASKAELAERLYETVLKGH